MRLDEHEKLERDLREACGQGNVEQAQEWALAAYGPEVMRLLAAVLHDHGRSREAFGLFRVDLRRGLPEFRWDCSFRSWAYRLARKACSRVMEAPPGGAEVAEVSGPPDEAPRRRAEERPWQRTSVRERLRALRESLNPRERLLLLLRVDQRMSWREVARVMLDQDEPLTNEAIDHEAIALRQQFQHIKAHLRTLGMEEGLISGEQAAPH
jgi:RNA polymerase sigma-70 factor (ECF subfamily)